MSRSYGQAIRGLFRLLVSPPIEPEQQLQRINFMEENVALPVKAVLLAMIGYFLFLSDWFEGVKEVGDIPIVLVQFAYFFYVAINVGLGILLLRMDRVQLGVVRWSVSLVNLLDAIYLAGISLLTGGLNSFSYWIFLALIVRNAVTMPDSLFQLTLNLLVICTYVCAGILDRAIVEYQFERQFSLDDAYVKAIVNSGQIKFAESLTMRISLMVLLAATCYGLQILIDRQRRSEEERRELLLRQSQLQSSGRLAAEIAHQIKNPLAIINNSVFVLQKQLRDKKGNPDDQLQIIRDEVERSDRILTELMGYAQLAEGKVESLNIQEEMERALNQVFPSQGGYNTTIRREYTPGLPALKMQQQHLREILVNLLQNAREAMSGNGELTVSTSLGQGYCVVVVISDTGPGIPPDKRERIFEPYFTTKEKGTGLGLAIVRHNAEVYGGTVKVDSGLGKGARFTLTLPSRTMLRLNA